MIAQLLALSLAGSCAAWPLGRVLGRGTSGWLLALLPAGLFAAFLGFTPAIAAGRVVTQQVDWAPALGVNLSLRLDGFSLLFALLITGIGALVIVYAGAYLSDQADAALTNAGFPIEAEWFAPHFEFRFPLYGKVEHGGLELELRQALEPWHVLGEDAVVGGTARYVDSSLERVQVTVRRMINDRHTVTCNGRTLPLTSTGVHGEAVAGVRFRAW